MKLRNMAGHLGASLLSVILTLLLCLMFLPETALAADSGSVTDETTGISVSKTAEALDDNLETKVTLSFPGKEDQLGSDIVFVLDKSGASDWSGIYEQAKEFLDYVKTQADEKGLDVKVGVVLFNYKGNVAIPLSDISTSYDEIIDAMSTSVYHGTNMHAGLLAGKEMLDNDTSVPASRKHLVLISDGATYLYSKDGDYTTCYSRSFGDPTLQTNPETGEAYGGIDRQGGIWEFYSRDYNVDYADDGSEGMAFYQVISDPDKLGTYLDLKRQQGADTFDEYDFVYGYDNGQTIPYANRTSLIPISTTAVANIDKAYVFSDDTFQAIAAEGYHTYVYYRNTADFDGSAFLQYLVRNTNNYQLDTDFADLENAVVNLISAGSSVDDQIGGDFDFVSDETKISLKIGDETLQTVKLSDTEYGFGTPTDGVYPFLLTYTAGDQENLHLAINQTVLASKPLTLTYSEILVNVPTESGTYQFDTNESAVLNCVDSTGNSAGTITFPVPQVTYTVSEEEESSESEEDSGTEEDNGTEEDSGTEGSSETVEDSEVEQSGETIEDSETEGSGETADNSEMEESGEASTSSPSPATGDDRSAFWPIAMLASLAVLIATAAIRKRIR